MTRNILLLLLAGWFIGCASQEAVEADKVIENVHVISMDGDDIQRDRTVFIKGDRIVRIAEADQGAADGDPERIDGGGGYLMPGLSEMHAHIPSGDADRAYIEEVLFLYLANGITTIRGMLGDPLHLELREQAAQNKLVSPHIYTSGPGFNGGSFENPDQARQQVRDQQEAGYNFLKIFSDLSLEEYTAIADEANAAGIEFSGHIPSSAGLKRALEAGQTTIDHLDKYVEALAADDESVGKEEDPGVIYFGMHLTDRANPNNITDIARQTADAGAWNVPTQALLEHVVG